MEARACEHFELRSELGEFRRNRVLTEGDGVVHNEIKSHLNAYLKTFTTGE